MALSSTERNALPADEFAVPGKRVLPINDARHVRMAWSQLDRTHGLTEDEKAHARERILHKAKSLGIDTSDWEAAANDEDAIPSHTRIAAQGIRLEGLGLDAMSLSVPAVAGHPNRMPFSGILTRLDTASDKPPGGAGGKLVILTRAAAERALPSLLGMAVDFTPDFDGHDYKAKIGVITSANIEGDAIHVGGFIYARDFPEEASRIQTDKALLGFSWELAEIYVESPDADPLVITDAYFTGAAILRKDKAAYGSTSLAASADEETMTKEDIAAAVGEAIAPALKPLADALTAMAEASTRQTEALTALQASAASSADAAAAAAAEAADKAKTDELEALKTKVADLQAAADKAKPEPARKTLSPQISALLAKADISVPEGDGKLSVGGVDQALSKAGLSIVQRMQIKGELTRAGAL